jgi:guanylate kinase
MNKNLLVLSSPSGGGKSTVARHLMKCFPKLKFSISATTRSQRPREEHGKDYFFLSQEEFDEKVAGGEFVEHEEIFGNRYGTLRSELEKAIENNEFLLFDIDVKGAMSLKAAFPDNTVLIFLSPQGVHVLEMRLKRRDTESEEQINNRLSRARMEMTYRDKFDYLLINDKLEDTLDNAFNIIKKYI